MDSVNTERIELLKALAVCAELTATEMSEAAARVMVDDLSAYPHRQVMTALTRCRREIRGRLTLAAILERLDDGRPGANEAWAMIPQSEAGSVVWTEEMAQSYGVASPLIDAGQIIAARSAFIEAYERAVTVARSAGTPVNWTPSLGSDRAQRVQAIETAIRLGRITEDHPIAQLPAPIARDAPLLISDKGTEMPSKVREQLRTFRLGVVK